MSSPLAPTPEEQQTARQLHQQIDTDCPWHGTVCPGCDAIASALAAARATDQQRIDRLKQALRDVRWPLFVASTYDVQGEAIGVRLHARDCAKAVAVIDEAVHV